MDDFGLTFTPTAGNTQRGQANGAASDNVQEAIRTLSLRIPKVGGAQGFSPLVGTGSGMTGTPQMSLEQLLARLFGQQGQGQPSVGGFGGSNQPAPSFVPGVVKDGSTPIPGQVSPLPPDPAPTPLPQPLPPQTWSERLPPKPDMPRSNFS